MKNEFLARVKNDRTMQELEVLYDKLNKKFKIQYFHAQLEYLRKQAERKLDYYEM